MKRLALIGTLACIGTLTPNESAACCGLHVTGTTVRPADDVTVVLMRDGTRTVVSMQSSYGGPFEQFAWVIPVPATVQQEHVKVLRGDLLDRVEVLASPRLVEYRELDPCAAPPAPEYGFASTRWKKNRVAHIQARFEVGEYDVALVSATDAGEYDEWLHANGFALPEQAGMKLLIARVDPAKVELDEQGWARLSPLRFHHDSDDFVLPLVVGARERDLVIHILAPGLRYRVADRPNVTIPTNLEVNEGTREQFDEFYAALVEHTLGQHPGAVITEYARMASACDQCPGPGAALSNRDLLELGGDVLPEWSQALATLDTGMLVAGIRAEKPTVVGAIDAATIRRVVGRELVDVRRCYNQGLTANSSIHGRVLVAWVIAASGQIESARVAESTVFDPEVGDCIARAAEQWRFPASSDGASVEVSQAFSLSRGGSKVATTPAAFVLTRLRIPHDVLLAGQALAFEAAPAIVGGLEIFDGEGKLEQDVASDPRRINDFLARHAIRHGWTDSVTCEDPIRGRWRGTGQPPRILGTSTAPPRAASLGEFVSESVGEQLGLRKSSSPEPVAAKDVEPALANARAEPPSGPAKTTGCACSVDSGSSLAALLAFFTLLGLGRARAAR